MAFGISKQLSIVLQFELVHHAAFLEANRFGAASKMFGDFFDAGTLCEIVQNSTFAWRKSFRLSLVVAKAPEN